MVNKEFKFQLPELNKDCYPIIKKGRAKVFLFLEHIIDGDPPGSGKQGHIVGIRCNKEGYEYLASYFALMALNENVSDGFHIHLSEDSGEIDYREDEGADNVVELTLYNPKYGKNIKKKK